MHTFPKRDSLPGLKLPADPSSTYEFSADGPRTCQCGTECGPRRDRPWQWLLKLGIQVALQVSVRVRVAVRQVDYVPVVSARHSEGQSEVVAAARLAARHVVAVVRNLRGAQEHAQLSKRCGRTKFASKRRHSSGNSWCLALFIALCHWLWPWSSLVRDCTAAGC
eukprot:366421-Chlamydomonas_euryale.AAC.19